MLLSQGSRVRLVEVNAARALQVAEEVPEARVFHATGLEPDFFERERINQAEAAVFAMRDDAKNHYAATLAKLRACRCRRHRPRAVRDRGPRSRGPRRRRQPEARDRRGDGPLRARPATQQVAMLEGDRFEVLDLVVRPESEYVGQPFREMPIRGA